MAYLVYLRQQYCFFGGFLFNHCYSCKWLSDCDVRITHDDMDLNRSITHTLGGGVVCGVLGLVIGAFNSFRLFDFIIGAFTGWLNGSMAGAAASIAV